MKKISNALIKDYTTYKLAGVVKAIYFPDDISELEELLKNLQGKYKVIGNGSNLIISSKYDGVLIKLEKFDKLSIDGTMVRAGCGYNLSKLSSECMKRGLSGLEFAFGIPATIGGAVCQNAGAYGKQMASVVQGVNVLDENYNILYLSLDDLKLVYRDSIFKHRKLICLEVFLKLKEGNILDIK